MFNLDWNSIRWYVITPIIIITSALKYELISVWMIIIMILAFINVVTDK